MSKKEQIKFTGDVIKSVQARGLKIGWFLQQMNISRTHWYFISKGDRVITEAKKQKIINFLNKN